MSNNITCQTLPSHLSSFIDTFIDFSVSGGLFLPQDENPKTLKTFYPTPTRLIAIGDLHGDLHKAKHALKLADLIDENNKWTGGSTTLVQVGDIFDRGGDEIKLLYLFEKLKREAGKVGGNVITMNGNHEIMNVESDFSFATRDGLDEFAKWGWWQRVGFCMKRACNVEVVEDEKDLFCEIGNNYEFFGVEKELVEGVRARVAGLRPNGLISKRFLAKNETVVVVGDSVFAHGGLLRKHVVYGFEKVNEEVRDWILGVKKRVRDDLVRGRDSIVWLRKFSHEEAKDCECELLKHVLETIPGVRRMVMGHTIQDGGINAVCGDRAVRIDVGMSSGCGDGFAEVLEISEEGVSVLTSNPKHLKGYEASKNVKRDGVGSLVDGGRARQVEVSA